MKIIIVIITAVIIYKLLKRLFPGHWILPAGIKYSFFDDLLKQKHLLVAGATGSGKSVVINGLIYHALYSPPEKVQFILIDPKRVELIDYKNLPHTLYYASEQEQFLPALKLAMDITEKRYKQMQRKHEKKYTGGDLYVIIDEYADLVTTCKKEVEPIIRRLCQIGRAAKVHVIACTQCPLKEIINTTIKVNFDCKVALHTESAQDSRNIIQVKGCETLPEYGYCYLKTPKGIDLWKIDYINDNELAKRAIHWNKQRKKHVLPMIG